VLWVEPERVDARRFERLVGEARRALANDPGLARERFEEALSLWRGRPLAGFEDVELARREAERLEELRVLATEGLVEARLGCGEHVELIGQITGLVAASPLRERPRRLLMLALYRGGRHAEALSAYRDACEALDEIGLQPGPELRELEEAILRHDPSLRPGNGTAGASPATRQQSVDVAAGSAPEASGLPISGTVAMLFSDIEGSTQLLHRVGELYPGALGEHHRVMREAIATSGGQEVSTSGDSSFAVFKTVAGAVDCAVHAQRALAAVHWPAGEVLRVRMGVHMGAPELRDGTYVGMDVHRAARVMGVAHGGQVLLTSQARAALGSVVQTRDLGYHRLKDLQAPEHLFQLLTPGLQDEFPALRGIRRGNLQVPATVLVGRQAEVTRSLDLLSKEEFRLLTLLGPGGVGKTRVAIEVGERASVSYRDGAWFVALAPIFDRAAMVSEIARLLEIDVGAAQTPERALLGALADRELLLVMDNFEHLLAVAPLVAELLASCPRVDVLATSREPLRLRGERRLEVPPLALLDAVELFVQRAREVRNDLVLDDEDRQAIARIAARLDRLPLALELAAARVAVLGPRALDARLAERLDLPEGPLDAPERQRTLSAAIDWSYRLLDDLDRRLLLSLAPFVGGVRADSAEELWGADAIDHLVALAEKSLLVHSEDSDREPRFTMLETIRQFALRQVEAERSTADASALQADHFATLVERAAAGLLSPGQYDWLDRLEDDHANIRAAFDHLTEHSPGRALQMAANLEWFWFIRGYAAEGRHRLALALAAAPDDSPHVGRAPCVDGNLAICLGGPREAQQPLLMGLPLAQRDGETRASIIALSNLGLAAEAFGDLRESEAWHERALAAAQAASDDWAHSTALSNHAVSLARTGNLERAHAMFEESLRLARRTGVASAVTLLANNLAEAALAAGDLDTAAALNDEVLACSRAMSAHPQIAYALLTRIQILLMSGDLDGAEGCLGEAIDRIRATKDAENEASLLSMAGTMAAMRTQGLRAALLWAAADQIRARVGTPDSQPAEDLRTAWQSRAAAAFPDEKSWEAARAAGNDLSIDEALSLALDDRELLRNAAGRDGSPP
jgi:predicted ATPase/class 3 adenylate cyclase